MLFRLLPFTYCVMERTCKTLSSPKREPVLSRPKRVVSNSSLTSHSNLRRLVARLRNVPVVFIDCLRSSDTFDASSNTVVVAEAWNTSAEEASGAGIQVWVLTRAVRAVGHNRPGHLTNQSRVGSQEGVV